MKNIIITGGAGFIGSHVVRLFVNKYSEYRIINVDVLTYAGNLENLSDIERPQTMCLSAWISLMLQPLMRCLINTSRKGSFTWRPKSCGPFD